MISELQPQMMKQAAEARTLQFAETELRDVIMSYLGQPLVAGSRRGRSGWRVAAADLGCSPADRPRCARLCARAHRR